MAQAITERVTVAIATSLVASLLSRRSAHLEILGVSTGLVWLTLDGQALTIQSVPTNSKLALPTSIFLQSGTPMTPEITLRAGRLSLDDIPLQITRWWNPPRSQVVVWNGGYGAVPDIDTLMGWGSGLTPEGDDLIAGWLVMARSIGHPGFEATRAKVLSASARSTTSFSAALLGCAAEGYGVSPLIDYVTSQLEDPKHSSDQRARLAQVGHTSGSALAYGVDLALGFADPQFNFTDTSSQERAIA